MTSSRRRHSPTRWAALDIGSTSVHLLMAEVSRPLSGRQRLHELGSPKKLVALAADLEARGHLRHATEARLVKAVTSLAKAATDERCQLLVTGTAALREAPDGETLEGRLAKAVGTPIRVLSRRREAQLGVLAAPCISSPTGRSSWAPSSPTTGLTADSSSRAACVGAPSWRRSPIQRAGGRTTVSGQDDRRASRSVARSPGSAA